MDSTNKVVAGVNVKTGAVEYYGSPKSAFEALFTAFAGYSKTCPCCPKGEVKPEKKGHPPQAKKPEPKK